MPVSLFLFWIIPIFGAAGDWHPEGLSDPLSASFLEYSESEDHLAKRELRKAGYLDFPKTSQGSSLLFESILNEGEFERKSLTSALRGFFSGVFADQWIRVPPGTSIMISRSRSGKPGEFEWDFPRNTTFVHRVWRSNGSNRVPFEFRVMKKTKQSWAFATYVVEAGELRFLKSPKENDFSVLESKSNRDIRLKRVGYSRCVSCHVQVSSIRTFPSNISKTSPRQLGPCDFLPQNPRLEEVLIQKFKSTKSFFACAEAVAHPLCPK